MKNPLITFAAVTGKPTTDEIKAYMISMKHAGIDQIMMYPRSGCELEYLSEEWFEKMGVFIKVAKMLDMNIWLYDEFNWPSGRCGDKVLAIPGFRLKSIDINGETPGKITSSAKFPDLMSPQAVDYFIESTHEKYYEKFREYFGNTIVGIFTDEPAVGYECPLTSVPYYEGLKEDYRICYNTDFDQDMKNPDDVFYKNVMELVSERFRKCYVSKIRKWCDDHGVLMTGHFVFDDSPSYGLLMNGNYLKNLSEFSLPGIDETRTNFSLVQMLAHLGALEYTSTSHGAMAELFGLGPIDMTYAKRKCMIFLCSAFKANHFFTLSHMDIRGNRFITDFFNNFSKDQPDFLGTRLLAEEVKIGAKYAAKDYVADVYVKYPREMCIRAMPERPDMIPFFKLINRLSYYQIQWKFVTEADCDGKRVIEYTDDCAYSFEGVVTADSDEICTMLKKAPRVTDSEGNLPAGVFVRLYEDGSIMAVNTQGKAGVYKVDGKEIYLDEYGVYTEEAESFCLEKTREKINAKFDVEYKNPNIIRAMYIDEQTEFKLFNNQSGEVRFAVRKDADAFLESEKITFSKDVSGLPGWVNKFYDISESCSLPKGEYTLKSGDDIKYLPSLLVVGDFTAKVNSGEVCDVQLFERARCYVPGTRFKDYGEVEFSAEVTVPQGVTAFEIKGTDLYTVVDMGTKQEKIHAPYIFDVNKRLWGKTVKLTITQFSSMGPAFGDIKYYDDNSKKVSWKGTPVPENPGFGFEEINWISAGGEEKA